MFCFVAPRTRGPLTACTPEILFVGDRRGVPELLACSCDGPKFVKIPTQSNPTAYFLFPPFFVVAAFFASALRRVPGKSRASRRRRSQRRTSGRKKASTASTRRSEAFRRSGCTAAWPPRAGAQQTNVTVVTPAPHPPVSGLRGFMPTRKAFIDGPFWPQDLLRVLRQ